MKRKGYISTLLRSISLFSLGILVGFGLYHVLVNRALEGRAIRYVLLGDSEQESGKTEEAKLYYAQAAALEPEWYGPHVSLAEIYESEQDYEQALQHYHTALRLLQVSSGVFGGTEDIEPLSERIEVLEEKRKSGPTATAP